MGKGGDKGKGKGYKGKTAKDPTKPYRGSRAGRNVQEKRERAYWRSQGWDLVDNEWCRLSDIEDEAYEPRERSRSPSVRHEHERSESLTPSLTSNEIRRELDKAIRVAQREIAARKIMEERLKALEDAILTREGGSASSAPYTAMDIEVDPPAPPSEAAISDEAKSQALSGSHRSQALSGSQHSRVASEHPSEVIVIDEALAAIDEADYERSSAQPSTKPTPTQSPRLQEESNLRLLPRQPPYPPATTYRSVAAKGASDDKGKGKSKGKGKEGKSQGRQSAAGKGTAQSSSSSNVDFRVLRGDTFDKPYVPRDFERRRAELNEAHGKTSQAYWRLRHEETREEADARSYAAKYLTDHIKWPDRGDVRRIGLDYHGVIQVRASGGKNRWHIPAKNLELIRALQDLNWRVFVISWVGSNHRRNETWREMQEGGLIDTVGADSIMIVDPFNHGPRSAKAAQCEGNRISIMVDDSPEVVQACMERNIIAIAVQGGQAFPEDVEAYSNLEQALQVEGILRRRVPQDR